MYHAMACLTVPKLYISVSFRKLAKRALLLIKFPREYVIIHFPR